LFFVISTAIAFSYSRSMLIVFALLMVILFFDNIRRFRIKYTGFMAVLTAAIVFYGIAKVPETTIWERLSTLTSPQTDTSLLRRSSYLLAAKDAIGKNPFIGAGPGTFPLIYQQSSYASAFAESAFDYARSAHNTYLEVAVGTGGTGRVLFFGLLFSAFAALYRAHNQAKSDDPAKAAFIRTIGWAFLAFLLALVFVSQLYHKYIWLLFGMALASNRMTVNHPLEEKVFSAHE
jgi:O-antigen ligase